MRRLLLHLAYSNLWISLNAAGFVLLNQKLMGFPLEARPAWLAFATMFMVYTFAKAVHFDPKADAVNDPQRTAFLMRWRVPLIGSACALYLWALWVSWSIGVLWLCLVPFLTALLYDLKWLPARWRYRRLKDIPGVKSLVVALTWALVTVMFPACLAQQSPQGLPVVFLWNALLWFVNTVFFDLGDMQGDALEGTETLPLVLGFTRTRLLLLALTGLASGLLEWARLQGQLPPCAAWANLVSLYTAAFVAGAQSPETDLGFLCDVVADGVGILAGLLALTLMA